MASDNVREGCEIFTRFLRDTCCSNNQCIFEIIRTLCDSTGLAGQHPPKSTYIIPLITGSLAELYIQPMLSCVCDRDIMFHHSTEFAIPEGSPPPTQLPPEFVSRLNVCEIREKGPPNVLDSSFPGYVKLMLSHRLTECTENGKYNVESHIEPGQFASYADMLTEDGDNRHGPARCVEWADRINVVWHVVRIAGKHYSRDTVSCTRCLSWPPQAANWPTRRKDYSWPYPEIVARVVSNGCDVVHISHRLNRQNKSRNHIEHRLSFSRAEIELLNSWLPVQQIVYHLLRVYVKSERFTDSTDDSERKFICNYHIKTLVLWACELKPISQWTSRVNVIRICVKLLHTLANWLTKSHCPHYFISNCNLFDFPDNSTPSTANKLKSVTEASLLSWFIDNYLRRCAQLCPDSVSQLFDDVSTSQKLENAVSAVLDWRSTTLPVASRTEFSNAQIAIMHAVSRSCLRTVYSCIHWNTELAKIDPILLVYFTAVTFLHVCCKISENSLSLSDELLDVLLTTILQSGDARRCLNARHSSLLSLSQADRLMKIVVNNPRSTVQLIEIELSKAYLHRALRCKDSDSDSIYCLANVHLAVLYYTTGQYQTAIDHCAVVMRSQDHSQCSSHVVQGELLPKIDHDFDSALGLSALYQYVHTVALNQQQQARNTSSFTAELFAHWLSSRLGSVLLLVYFIAFIYVYWCSNLCVCMCVCVSLFVCLCFVSAVLLANKRLPYLHMRSVSAEKHHQFTQTATPSADVRWLYQKSTYELPSLRITDMLGLLFRNTECPVNCRRLTVIGDFTKSVTASQFDTSKLVELLQQSAIEHLTSFRQLEAQKHASILPIGPVVTTEFDALYAYKCGKYERCLLLAAHGCNVCRLLPLYMYPEVIQLLDDELVSLIGLTWIIKPLRHEEEFAASISWPILLLYLMTQCRIKLNLHPSLCLPARAAGEYCISTRPIDRYVLKLVIRKLQTYTGKPVCCVTSPKHIRDLFPFRYSFLELSLIHI